jgi:hypothetical protein
MAIDINSIPKSDYGKYGFSMERSKCSAAFRNLADMIDRGDIALQRVSEKRTVRHDEFPMTIIEIEFAEPIIDEGQYLRPNAEFRGSGEEFPLNVISSSHGGDTTGS